MTTPETAAEFLESAIPGPTTLVDLVRILKKLTNACVMPVRVLRHAAGEDPLPTELRLRFADEIDARRLGAIISGLANSHEVLMLDGSVRLATVTGTQPGPRPADAEDIGSESGPVFMTDGFSGEIFLADEVRKDDGTLRICEIHTPPGEPQSANYGTSHAP